MAYQNQRPTVSSSAFNLWDESSHQFRLSVMDSGLLLAIWNPYFGVDGRRSYPPEQRMTAKIGPSDVLILDNYIVNTIIPAYEAGKSVKKGLYTNNARTTIVEIECRDGMFYLWIHTGVDPTTHQAQTTSVFKFSYRSAISDYNAAEQKVELESFPADFYLFAKAVHTYAETCGGVVCGNGTMTAAQNHNLKVMDYLRAIATAVHAQLPNPAVGTYSSGGYGDQRSNVPPGSTQPQEVTDVTDLM